MVFVPDRRRGAAAVRAGEWSHVAAARPHSVWMAAQPRRVHRHRRAPGADRGGDVQLIARAAVPVSQNGRRLGYVIVDIPDRRADLRQPLRVDRRQGRFGELGGDSSAALPSVDRHRRRRRRQAASRCSAAASPSSTPPDWDSGAVHRATISITYTLRELYEKLSAAQSAQVGDDVARPGDPAHPGRRRVPVPDHRVRRAGHGPGAGALDHQLDPRAVHGHRAGAARATSRIASTS